jgi:hypothetical protein
MIGGRLGIDGRRNQVVSTLLYAAAPRLTDDQPIEQL